MFLSFVFCVSKVPRVYMCKFWYSSDKSFRSGTCFCVWLSYVPFLLPCELNRWCIQVLRAPLKGEVKSFNVEFLYSAKTVGVIWVLLAVLITYLKLIRGVNPLASWEIPPVINSQLSWLKGSKPEIPIPQTTPASPTVYAGNSALLFLVRH